MGCDHVEVGLEGHPTMGHQESGPVGELKGDPQQPCGVAGREQFPMECGMQGIGTLIGAREGVPCLFDPRAVLGIALGD